MYRNKLTGFTLCRELTCCKTTESLDLCLVQSLQSLFMVPLDVFQFFHSMFLLLQRLHVKFLTFHLGKELIHCLSTRANSIHNIILQRDE